VVCHIPLESSWQGLQCCFKTHLNLRFACKVMGPQSRESPNFGNFGTPIWESRDKMPFGCGPQEEAQSILKGGRWWLPPSRSRGESCESNCPWLVLTPKVLQLCTNHLVLVLCRSMWVVDACHFPNLIPELQHAPSTPSKVLWTRERASTPCSSVVFNLYSRLSPFKSLGSRHL
jgi:hypothetical protein